MTTTLRLLLLGSEPLWLPPFRAGRLLVGSAATADVRLQGAPLLPFHCLVEVEPGGTARVHDLSRQGDVLDATGARLPAEGLRLAPGAKFSIAGWGVALMGEETEGSLGDPGCIVCGVLARGRVRAVAGAVVCEGCAGVTDLDPFAFRGYELVAALGAGAMGAVYLARAIEKDQLVALKVIRAGSVAPTVVARFEREARVLAGLDHPNVVRTLDAGTSPAGPFLVCELVRGGDAAARLAREGPFPAEDVARLGIEIASALAFLLANGIVHRDVKPANILLEKDLSAKLSDFGLSKDLTASGRGLSTASGATLGTIAYAAPEQLRDARGAGPPADVFGLGATLFHLATGQPPRQSLSIGQLRHGVFETLPDASTISRDVPRALSDVLATALQPHPWARPSATELGAALVRVLFGLRGGSA